MNIDNKALLNAVLETLRNDEALSSYVKTFSHGAKGQTHKIFPFVEVGNIHIREEQRLAASIYLMYTVEIVAGVRSLAPGAAYMGSTTGKKGINDMCDDICNAVRGKTFNNLLQPVFTITSNPNYSRDKGETMHLGIITFTSRCIERL